MARIMDLGALSDDIRKSLARLFQSGHVNFLIGSGASFPAIAPAGAIEKEIAELFAAGKDAEARHRLYEFLAGLQQPTNRLIDGDEDQDIAETLERYEEFLGIVEKILSERRTTLLRKQATIFTTNYDLFIEKASARYSALKLNDGFSRAPSLDNRMEYSSRTFFDATYNTGNLYDYVVEIPAINLVKLHGSLSWMREDDEILFRVQKTKLLEGDSSEEEIKSFIENYAVVLPQTNKFWATLMDRTYYELLRIYANQLDRENVLIVSFGFSFGDEHIRDITIRALKNPTLRLVVFAFSETAKDSYADIFAGHNNVDIIAPEAETKLDFEEFNKIIYGLLPRTMEGK